MEACVEDEKDVFFNVSSVDIHMSGALAREYDIQEWKYCKINKARWTTDWSVKVI